MELFQNQNYWVRVKDGNAEARDIFHRHYSYRSYKDGRNPKLFVGPGYKVVLIGRDKKALFVWRKFISGDGQKGVNCSVFRNESEFKSSDLILQAEKIIKSIFPNERLFTYVNSKKITSNNPGYCFKKAGWKLCGVTKRHKLLILEKV